MCYEIASDAVLIGLPTACALKASSPIANLHFASLTLNSLSLLKSLLSDSAFFQKP